MSEMLPVMLESTWEIINSGVWTEGGWMIGELYHVLVVEVQGDARCWVAKDRDPPCPDPPPEPDPPPDYYPMPALQWEKVFDGELDPGTNTVIKNNNSHEIWAVEEGVNRIAEARMV